MSQTVYIVAAKRTPVGAFLGSLSNLTAIQLGITALKAALQQSGVALELVEELYMGNVVSANLGQAPATQVARGAGLGDHIPATQVNKVCASGAKAVMLAAQAIRLGEAHIMAAGGMESMSTIPHYVKSYRTGHKYGNIELIDGIVRDGLQDPFKTIMMGEAAEMLADRDHYTREQQDAYAIESYKRAQAAQKGGKFAGEIAPVTISGPKGDTIITDDDEPFKTNFDKIPTLKPAFRKEGTVTAANASKLNDGASALILASEEAVKKHNLKPLARIVSYADAQLAPEWFTVAPAEALPKALQRAGKTMKDMELVEINEAFSVVAMANAKLLDIPMERLNIYGGGVSIGHPIGSSGSRILTTLTHALHQENKTFGCIGICNGGGGASAIIIEKV